MKIYKILGIWLVMFAVVLQPVIVMACGMSMVASNNSDRWDYGNE